jgi:hypothetical protein
MDARHRGTRFGWGRMMLGALLIYSAVTGKFHLFPTRHFEKQLEYDNQTQAAATIAVFLILSGIWKGFQRETIRSTTDKEFLKRLEDWLDSQLEIMVLIRHSRAAGNNSIEFFTSFAALSERLHQLEPQTCITAFRRPQLPLRGIVDDPFIDACLSNIPDGSEFVVAETVCRTADQYSWFHYRAGETHEELRESLEASRGSPVAVGEYPRREDSRDVISGYVPDEDGVARTGVY